jgi:formate hydrogenlyase subunit 3/multisubunit Na+/H+ antiporter MnhD subunit
LNGTLLMLCWLTPLLLAVPGLGKSGRFLPALATIPALAAAVLVPTNATAEIPWLLLGVRLGLDETSRIFLLFTAVLWLAAGAQAALQMSDKPHAGRFRLFFLLAMSGNFGLIIGQDLVSFYLGFTVMGFAAYGLVVHDGNAAARRAGRVYLIMTLIAELALFAGLLLLYQRTGNLAPAAGELAGAAPLELALLSLAFAIKAGLIGVHIWLPLAHPAAPVAASAVLSGTMIKAALIGWLRYLPLGEAAMPEFGSLLLMIGALTALFSAGVGLVQWEPKAVLAYSSIGKMGIMSAIVGLVAIEPRLAAATLPALALYAAHHGLTKGALFLGVGVVKGIRMRWTLALLVIPALALAGAPLTSGAVAKDALKSALDTASGGWTGLMVWLLLASTIGATLLMCRFLYLMRQQLRSPATIATQESNRTAAPLIGLLLIVAAIPIIIGQPVLPTTDTIAIALSITVAAAVFYRAPPRLTVWVGRIPPGDLLIPLQGIWVRLLSTRIVRAASTLPSRLCIPTAWSSGLFGTVR